MHYFIEALKKYAVFTGRARRKEYWFFILVNLFNSYLTLYMDVTFGTIKTFNEVDPPMQIGIINTIYSLAVLIPGIAVAVRRMHDVGKSGWFVLIPIYNLILALTPGDVGENKYGPDPKELEAAGNNLSE